MFKKYFEKYKLLIFKPNEFLKSIKNEDCFFDILKFYVFFVILSQLIYIIFNIPTMVRNPLIINLILFDFIYAFVCSLVVPYIFALLIHLGILIFGGRQGYFNTFKPMTYALAVTTFYSAIMFAISGVYTWFYPIDFELTTINFFWLVSQLDKLLFLGVLSIVITIGLLIHSFYIQINGLSMYQNISKIRAVLALLLIMFITFIILASIFLYITFKILESMPSIFV